MIGILFTNLNHSLSITTWFSPSLHRGASWTHLGLSFNSLSDSHITVFAGTNTKSWGAFQFPIGFSQLMKSVLHYLLLHVFQFPIGFSHCIIDELPSCTDKLSIPYRILTRSANVRLRLDLTFNSLSDSHAQTQKRGVLYIRCHFQFPIGFSRDFEKGYEIINFIFQFPIGFSH